MKRLKLQRSEKGQSLMEFVLVLPLLLAFILVTAEIGFLLYNYMNVAGANREGVRLASRGRFTDNSVVARVISSGGLREVAPGVTEPNLRTTGTSSNFGVIVTRISIPYDVGANIEISTYVSGTLVVHGAGSPVVRAIEETDGRIAQMSGSDLMAYLDVRRDVAAQINAYKIAEDYDITSHEVYIIVETFFAHASLTKLLPVIDDPFTIYYSSTMRVMQDGRVE